MKPLRNEYWDFDPHRIADERARIWVEMPQTGSKPHDAPYQSWIEAGHASRRQQALHTHRAFAPILHELEDLIDRGEPLTDHLTERFRVSANVIKWLRYSKDDYAIYLLNRFPGDRFAILCHWLNQIYKVERPHTPEDLHWFVRGNRFIEWQVGLFGGDTAEIAQGVRGRWYWFCVDIGTAIRRTRHLEHRLIAETVYRWREHYALDVLRALGSSNKDPHDDLLQLTITPSWQDLRDTGFKFGRINPWSYNLHRKPVDDPAYWLQRSRNPKDRSTEPSPHYSESPEERASAILKGAFNPTPLPCHVPKDQYPFHPRAHRRRRT